jgi:hypothetical protein
MSLYLERDVMLERLLKETGLGAPAISEWINAPHERLGGRTPWSVWVECGYEALVDAMGDLAVVSALYAYPALLGR